MPRMSATTRTKIVNEAYRHAREGGLAALSVRSVTRDCGVSVGTLYNYFPDKAALTAAVIDFRLRSGGVRPYAVAPPQLLPAPAQHA